VAIELRVSEEIVKVFMKHILKKLPAIARIRRVTVALRRGIIEL
jgi:DNA-binding NarL/FixJ family response regulator